MPAIKLKDPDGICYIMPGGGQEPEELLPETLAREVEEETGIRIRCRDAVFIIEGRHGEEAHRVDIVFACDDAGEDPNAARKQDANQIGCEWLAISRLHTTALYPSKLGRPIMNYYEGKACTMYLGNEDMGGPECVE